MAARTRNLITGSLQQHGFPHTTKDLEVHSPGLIPLTSGVCGQRPRCLLSLRPAPTFLVPVCGHLCVVRKEWEDEGLRGAPAFFLSGWKFGLWCSPMSPSGSKSSSFCFYLILPFTCRYLIHLAFVCVCNRRQRPTLFP